MSQAGLLNTTSLPGNIVGPGTSTPGDIVIFNNATGTGLADSGLNIIHAFPITPYVVGPVGAAGYQTIQSALDAATAAGGGTVYVQSSATPYTENLVFYPNVSVVGVPGDSDTPSTGNTVTIVGSHTPPTSGHISIKNCYLMHATAIFFSAAAGTAEIILSNCVTEVTNGYIFDMVSWVAPGAFIGFNNNSVQGVNSAWINNTDQATVYIQDSRLGSGTGNTMIVSGAITLKNVDFFCPLELRKNIIGNIDNCRFTETVTATVNATGIINFSRFDPNSNGPAFVMNSTDPIRLSNCLFNTPNNPCIAGTGGGLLTLTSATFIDNAIIAGTVNVTAASAFLPASFGTTGQVFTSNGPGVVPSFQAAAGVTAPLTLTGAGLTPLTLISTDAGATAGPIEDNFRDSASPAAADVIGRFIFNGRDSAANKQEYARIEGRIVSPTSTAETGALDFYTENAGAAVLQMSLLNTGGQYRGNNTNTAPPAGFIGEVITSTSGSVSIPASTNVVNVTSISLTPGIWNVSAIGNFSQTGVTSILALCISTTSATLTGTAGDNQSNFTVPFTANQVTLVIPALRAALSATTTYFLCATATFSTGSSVVNVGRLSATRVG